MKKRVVELVHGSFTCEVPRLIASVSEFQLAIPEGNKYRGSFSIGAEDGSKIKGLVTSDSHRILTANDKFVGIPVISYLELIRRGCGQEMQWRAAY